MFSISTILPSTSSVFASPCSPQSAADRLMECFQPVAKSFPRIRYRKYLYISLLTDAELIFSVEQNVSFGLGVEAKGYVMAQDGSSSVELVASMSRLTWFVLFILSILVGFISIQTRLYICGFGWLVSVFMLWLVGSVEKAFLTQSLYEILTRSQSTLEANRS
jgi:hypothetical protein